MLFSEPKIPQCSGGTSAGRCDTVSVLFSEPKIPQSLSGGSYPSAEDCFSALQRAENSSMLANRSAVASLLAEFQCSSASRKFLNFSVHIDYALTLPRFSALQRAENSSIPKSYGDAPLTYKVSVLFSEPKIPQSRPSHLRPSIFPTAMITLRHS